MAELGEILYVEGDATHETTLRRAKVESARGLVSTLPEDKDNLFVVISARKLNPDLRIVARAILHESESKLQKVGADRTVSANLMGGLRMAAEMIRPTVISFLDSMLRNPRGTIRVEEALVGIGSPLNGQTLGEMALPQEIGLLVIAVQDCSNQHYIYNPPADYVVKANDVLIIMGDSGQVASLRQLTRGAAS